MCFVLNMCLIYVTYTVQRLLMAPTFPQTLHNLPLQRHFVCKVLSFPVCKCDLSLFLYSSTKNEFEDLLSFFLVVSKVHMLDKTTILLLTFKDYISTLLCILLMFQQPVSHIFQIFVLCDFIDSMIHIFKYVNTTTDWRVSVKITKYRQ